MTSIRAFVMAALAAVFIPVVHAATFVVPPDAKLIEDSRAIVSATIVAAEPRFDGNGDIETVFTVRVDEVLKGAIDSQFVSLIEFGGRIGDRATVMSGAPRYEIGKNYLVFLTANRKGEWTTQHLTLGRFERVRGLKGDVLVRDAAQIHGWDVYGNEPVEHVRSAEPFRQFIRERVAGRTPRAAYFADGIVRNDQTQLRSTTIEPNAADYDFENAAQVGASAWTNDGGSDVHYSISASPASSNVKAPSDGEDKIIEEDPNDIIAGAFTGSGTVAVAYWSNSGSHMFEGASYNTIIGADVVTQNGVKASSFSQNKMRTALVHELGHTLGFRHSNEFCTTAVPCTSSAVMNSSVGSFNGNLQQWDIDAVNAVYGSGGTASDYAAGRRPNTTVAFRLAKQESVCTPVSILTQPAALTNISLGATTQLSVIAAGTGLSYQWYSGVSPDTSEPIGVATTSKLNVTPQSVGTYNLWVRISNTCDHGSSVNSNTATIVAACVNPGITTQPQSVSIAQGNSTQLSVTAIGTGLTYAWFRGETGDTSTPAGGNSNKLTVSPSATTKYWVRVSGQCGHPVESVAATVTVTTCASITMGQPTSTAGTPGKFTLSITASSTAVPVTYEWFKGTTPGSGGEKIASTQSVQVTVTGTTSFWARVKNGCNRTEVSTLITVGGVCTLPSITTEPSDKTINSGQTANLSVAFANGLSVKWYRGAVGDRNEEVGATADITVGPLTATTQYWAEVTGACGAVSSRQVTVTVGPSLTELVPMLNGRFFVQVRYKNQFDNGKEGKLLGRSQGSTPLSDTAVFTFGDEKVIELMVRLSDARPFDDHIHVFLGGLSDVEFFVVVTDSLTGIIHEYGKPANKLVGVIDRATFPASNGLRAGFESLKVGPTAESSTIRLLNNRFEVRMRYRNQFTNPAGEGYMNARSIASSPTTETAVFFFDENFGSAEWMVRFSDARPFAERIDLFHGGLSDVEFTIEVLDTQTGLSKEYHKPPFSLLGEVDRDSYLP
jgi:Ig-like domain CHU_C associated